MVSNKHEWVSKPFGPGTLVFCKLCGIVKRPDGRNKPCPGSGRVVLKEK